MKLVLTAQEKAKLMEEIDQLSESLYKTKDKGFERVYDKMILIKPLLDNEASISPDTTMLGHQLSHIKEIVNNIDPVKITIAVVPDENLTQKIKEWAERNLGDKVILDIKTDYSILGGSRIIYKGIFKDYSINSLLSSYFKDYHNVSQLPR